MRCLRVLPFAQEGEKKVDSFASIPSGNLCPCEAESWSDPYSDHSRVWGRKRPGGWSLLPVLPPVDGFKRLWMDRFEGCAARILKNVNLKLYLLRKLLLILWKMSLWTVYTSWIQASDLWMFFRVTERVLWEVGGYSQLLERSRCGWWKREGDCAPKTYSRTDLWGWTVAERRHHLPQYGRGAWLRNFQGCKFILFLTYFQHGTRLIKQRTLSKRQISAYGDGTVLFCRFWKGSAHRGKAFNLLVNLLHVATSFFPLF